MASKRSRLRSIASTMRPANGAVRPIISAGAVSTMGTSTFTPGVLANSRVICGSTGAISTAPSTAMMLPASSRTSWGVPATRSVDVDTCPASLVGLIGGTLTAVLSDMIDT